MLILGRKERIFSPKHGLKILLIGSVYPRTTGGSEVKVSACIAGDPGLIPGSERSPGEGNGSPLQCSCLENPMDRGSRAGITKSQTRLYNFHFHCFAQFHAITLPFLFWVRSQSYFYLARECLVSV